MKVILAKELGFCFGVKRAFELAKNSPENTAIMGELVHNSHVQQYLYDLGIKDFNEFHNVKNLIIRSHGIELSLKNQLAKKYRLIDTTCPVLINIYKKMNEMNEKGYNNIIIGDKNHPEVQATRSQVEGTIVVDSKEDIDKLTERKYFVSIQTTYDRVKAEILIKLLKEKIKENLVIMNSICNASIKRREALIALTNEVEAIIVLGNKNSNNTKELVKILDDMKFPNFFINSIKSLDLSSIKRYNSIGITAGASTPDWIIEEAVRVLNDMNNDKNIDFSETKIL